MAHTVIVGSGGRLGRALVREWSGAGESVTGFTRAELDLCDREKLQATLEQTDFDVLVNCAALTNVDRCETHPAEAYQANAESLETMAEVCGAKGARLVHISTDYVFDGEKGEAYTEEDEAKPISHYGASKLAGEQTLARKLEDSLSVRVSWVFGPDRPSFIDQILNRALEYESAQAIADKWAVPTYALDISTLLRPFLREKRETGVLHLCNGGGCTWQEYGQYAIDVALACGTPLKARKVDPLKMADLKAFIARRPPYTVMSTEKLARLTGTTPRPWKEAVESYVRDSWVPALAQR
ncbi:MAG: dTDP-4-dehydrorhamnose reductase [Chthoniobacteraceae bacterium]